MSSFRYLTNNSVELLKDWWAGEYQRKFRNMSISFVTKKSISTNNDELKKIKKNQLELSNKYQDAI